VAVPLLEALDRAGRTRPDQAGRRTLRPRSRDDLSGSSGS
jgi:hypothetical protein